MADLVWTFLNSVASTSAFAGLADFLAMPFAARSWWVRAYDWLVNALTDPKRFLQFSFAVVVFGFWIIWWRKK